MLVHDLRQLRRGTAWRDAPPTAAVLDSRTLQSTPESGGHDGDDGAKRKRGGKVHPAVDTLGHQLALRVTAADAQDRAQVDTVAPHIWAITGSPSSLLMSTRATRTTPAKRQRRPPRRTAFSWKE
jgi:hypothetical protein